MIWNEWRLLLSWLFWFGLFFIGALIAWHQGFVGYLVYSDSTYITAFILFVTIIGLIWNFRNMAIIQLEIYRAYKLNEKIANQNLSLTSELLTATKGLCADHINQLLSLQNRDFHPNQDNLIEILYTRLLLPEKWTFYISNAVTVLGFLGTLIGFAMMGDSLVSMMSGSVSIEKATSGIVQVIGSIRIAINTTIVGLIGFLILTLFHLIVDNGTTKLIAAIAEIGEKYIIPALPANNSPKEVDFE